MAAASPASVDARSRVPTPRQVRRAAREENFPVTPGLLGLGPRGVRADLLAVYRYARFVDDLGDESPGDRRALLDAVEADLDRLFAGRQAKRPPELPPVAGLQPAVRRHGLPREPFQLLLEANRQDQHTTRYAGWEDLLGYCRLSANPVGDLVLRVFGAWTPERLAWSDRICTGLQLVEHWQDVGEDARRGRVYLPATHRARHQVGDGDLIAAQASEPLRGLLAEECQRAREMLLAGAPLVRDLHGAARLAVAGYAAGGLAALDAIRDARFDVLGRATAPRRSATARHALRLLAGRPA